MDVYLIEDDEIYSEFIRKSLSQSEYNIRPFYSAEDCLKELNGDGTYPEVFIIDYKLPGMNGIDFFQEVHQKVDDSATKMIILSAIDDGNLVLDFIQKGVRDYVIKDEQVIHSLVSIMEGNDDDYYFFDE